MNKSSALCMSKGHLLSLSIQWAREERTTGRHHYQTRSSPVCVWLTKEQTVKWTYRFGSLVFPDHYCFCDYKQIYPIIREGLRKKTATSWHFRITIQECQERRRLQVRLDPWAWYKLCIRSWEKNPQLLDLASRCSFKQEMCTRSCTSSNSDSTFHHISKCYFLWLMFSHPCLVFEWRVSSILNFHSSHASHKQIHSYLYGRTVGKSYFRDTSRRHASEAKAA